MHTGPTVDSTQKFLITQNSCNITTIIYMHMFFYKEMKSRFVLCFEVALVFIIDDFEQLSNEYLTQKSDKIHQKRV